MTTIHAHAAEILILLFLAITFILSGIEKVSDWKGNVSFTKSHFEQSPLKNYVPLLLSIVLVTELVAGALMFIGCFHLLLTNHIIYALYGLELSGLTLLFLLIGQRLAKDYPGAMSLTVYFILTVFGIYLLNN